MLVGHFKERCCRGGWIQGAELPTARVTNPDLNLRNALILLVARHAGGDAAADLDLPRALDIQRGVECHLELALGVLGEHALVGLLEQGGVKGISHHHETASHVCACLYNIK